VSARFLRLNPLLLLTMLFWGFNFVALKLVLVQMTPAAAALVRFFIMYAILITFCRLRRLPLDYPPEDRGRILFMGFLAMGVYMVFFTYGMKDSTAAEGAIILGAAPVFTLLFAILAGQERFNWAILGSISVAFAGVSMVVLGATQGDAPAPLASAPAPSLNIGGLSPRLIGNLSVFISAAIWAWSAVVSRPLSVRHDPLRLLTLSMPGGLIALLPFGLLDLVRTDWLAVTPLTWLMMLYFAGLAGAIGFIFFYTGVRQVGAPGAMVYQYLVPCVAALSGWLALRQGLHPLQLAGLVVVIAGVALSTSARRRHAPRP
jgi:drug/metabolite transporter (DMT)-like permease